jgi:hypothetical protein
MLGSRYLFVRQFPSEVVKVEIDPDSHFPDVRRDNNGWPRAK